MGTSTSVAGLKLLKQGKEPIHIYGTPGQLAGMLNVSNESGAKVTLRSIPVDAPELKGVARQQIHEVMVSARLKPNQQGSMPFQFPIDPSTPPGTYSATLKVGDSEQAAQIHVSEHIQLSVQPDSLTLVTDGERKFEREFLVSNTGNVAVPLGDKCVAPLQSPQGLPGMLQDALRVLRFDDGDQPRPPADVLSDMLRAMAEQQPGLVVMTRENLTLKPGESKLVKGSIELPKNMQPYTHYTTDVEMFSATIRLHIYTRRLRRGGNGS